ncbi:MAG: zinc finger-like domain-containing protein [Syntrophomonas sp.]
MLDITTITKQVQSDISPEIKKAREESSAYIRHFFGMGTQEYLEQINRYENDKQHELRKKHAITNPWIVSELLRPVDNIWQAKGGDTIIKFKGEDKTEEFKERLKDVKDGMSMRQFMKDIWFQRFISDPNGIIFLEVARDGSKAELTYKSIHNIHAYDTDGVDIEWIIFEPAVEIFEGEKKDQKVSYSWVVDEQFYYYVKNDGKEVSIVEVIENNFGMVPGVVNSTIYNTEKKIKDSFIAKQVDLLNSYLTKNSVKEIYQFLHNYPLFWMIESLCPTCNGARKVGNEVCGTCKGSGYSARKDVSDVFIYPKAEVDINREFPPAGYIQPEVETCAENRTELDWLFDKMFHSLWGTTVEKSENETATGRFIDVQAVYNKLNEVADIAQLIEAKLTLIYGKFWYLLSLDAVQISYSRRYIAESPDVLWLRYEDARAKGAPTMTLNYMLEQFYYSEFASNPTMADYYIKLMYVEPFVHVNDASQIPEPDKTAKLYFQDWIGTLKEEQIIKSDIKKLKSLLFEYTKTKQTNGKENQTGSQPGNAEGNENLSGV